MNNPAAELRGIADAVIDFYNKVGVAELRRINPERLKPNIVSRRADFFDAKPFSKIWAQLRYVRFLKGFVTRKRCRQMCRGRF